MVFTTLVRFAKDKGPDEVWRKRRIFKMAAVSNDIPDQRIPRVKKRHSIDLNILFHSII